MAADLEAVAEEATARPLFRARKRPWYVDELQLHALRLLLTYRRTHAGGGEGRGGWRLPVSLPNVDGLQLQLNEFVLSNAFAERKRLLKRLVAHYRGEALRQVVARPRPPGKRWRPKRWRPTRALARTISPISPPCLLKRPPSKRLRRTRSPHAQVHTVVLHMAVTHGRYTWPARAGAQDCAAHRRGRLRHGQDGLA